MKNKIRIAVNSRLLKQGNSGIAKYISSLYNEMRLNEQFEIIFVPGVPVPRSLILNSSFASINGLISFLHDTFVFPIVAKIKRCKVAHSPSFVSPLIRFKSTKYFSTIHDLDFLINPENNPLLFRFYSNLMVRWTLWSDTTIILDSLSTSRDVKTYLKPQNKKLYVVYLGAEVPSGKCLLDKSERYFLSVCTHPVRKNIVAAIKAFALFVKKEASFSYIIVGNLDQQVINELKRLAEEFGVANLVFFEGYVDERRLNLLYSKATALIYPSLYEGFGLPILEAMIRCCPVIASNSSSIPEIVPNDRWLSSPTSIDDLSNKMVEMANISDSERSELIAENLCWAKKFTWKHTSFEMTKIYMEILNG